MVWRHIHSLWLPQSLTLPIERPSAAKKADATPQKSVFIFQKHYDADEGVASWRRNTTPAVSLAPKRTRESITHPFLLVYESRRRATHSSWPAAAGLSASSNICYERRRGEASRLRLPPAKRLFIFAAKKHPTSLG